MIAACPNDLIPGPHAVTMVVVGQTPPPYHGQSIMIQQMLAGEYGPVRLAHVRMNFSRDFSEMKKLRLGKGVELLRVIASIVRARFREGASVLYYPPSGPDLLPVLRDIAILCATRWMFRRTILHFHAGGLMEIYPRLSAPLRWLFRRAFEEPDLAIRLSAASPEDGRALHARHEVMIPNGVDDSFAAYAGARTAGRHSTATILFVGMLDESKGVLVLIDAAARLKARAVAFRLEFMGRFVSAEFEAVTKRQIAAAGLEREVSFLGVLTGEAKYKAFARADVFCFPSHYESESFPVVLIEAMSFCLPVVSTRWRGIPSLVEDGESAYLVEPGDSGAIADRLAELVESPALRESMGAAGRRRYLALFTMEHYRAALKHAFESVLIRPVPAPAEHPIRGR